MECIQHASGVLVFTNINRISERVREEKPRYNFEARLRYNHIGTVIICTTIGPTAKCLYNWYVRKIWL